MIDERKQHISALADGERADNLPQLLDDMARDDSLRGTWERYQLIGRAMRGEPIDPTARGSAARVARALAAEPVPISRSGRHLARTARAAPLIGGALAAAAMVAAVVTVPPLFQQTTSDPSLSRVSVPRGWVSAGAAGEGSGRHLQPRALADKLDLLFVNHQEAMPGAHVNVKGMLPYATLVGYGLGR